MSVPEKLLGVCTVLYCLTSSGCVSIGHTWYDAERARESEVARRSSVQPNRAYEVPWSLIIVDEAPITLIMKITVFDPEASVSSTKWQRLQYPFKGGILRSHMIKETMKPNITSVLDVFYDLYFIFQDGTVAEKHFNPVDIEEHYGRQIDILPEPRQTPSKELRDVLNAQGTNPEADVSIPEADALYEEALQLKKKGGGFILFRNEKLLRQALDKFNELMNKYPTSNKIDEALFKAAELYEYFKDYSKAVLYYKRAFFLEPNASYPAGFRAAHILDRGLNRKAEALALYKEVMRTYKGKDPQWWRHFARRRINDLSKHY